MRRREVAEELRRLVRRLVHLPVAGEHGPADAVAHAAPASSRAATPGSTRPSRNSRDAPPPVDTCDTRSATPAASTAAAVSPPPTIVTAPASVASATARATPIVP